MDFDVVIGLEIHVEMKTNSKMFSLAPVSFGAEPNTQLDIFDMAFPGVMPTLNKQAVINSLRVCHALNMTIDDTIIFERKNYFYSDLPKGYQITQEFRPIGKNGYLDIETSYGVKRILIESLQMEEDTCKQIHLKDCSLLDYNRSGIPLIEIVTSPDFKNGEEASKFVEKIRSIVTYLGVSDGKMEKGSIRCDVNVSLKQSDSNKLGTRVEIKNLNSISNIQKAIDYEIAYQSNVLSSGGRVKQETKRFDEHKKVTVPMRIKLDAIDYRYFTDPNIPPIKLSKEFITEAINTSPELRDEKIKRYKSLGLNDYDSNLLTADIETSKYFDEGIKLGVNPKKLANWIISDIQSVLNKREISIDEFNIRPQRMVELIKLIESNTISHKQARDLFNKMLDDNCSPKQLYEQNIGSNVDNDSLHQIIKEIVAVNAQTVRDYNNGKDRALGYLVGQAMKELQGKADPALLSKLIKEEIKRS